MSIKFTKMHGLGNDFMVIDGINQSFTPTAALLKKWSDRHFGIGFDQLLLVEAPEHKDAEFKYRIFNADGGEVEQCGNGARCFARFVREKGLTQNTCIKVETASGLIALDMVSETEVKVNMGAPHFAPDALPINSPQQDTYQVQLKDKNITFSAVSMGNPHAVIEVDNIDTAPVEEIGKLLQAHELFPNSVNVGFMQIIDQNNIKCRVYERGVGETIACGTGACAAAVAGQRLGKLSSNVTVHVTAGTLNIQWQGNHSPVFMTGTTASVFEGITND